MHAAPTLQRWLRGSDMSNTHQTVARNWANQTGKASRGFNMFYDGATIYSYGRHYAIARLVTVNGKRVALVNSRGYSVSTAKHTSLVRRALNVQTFTVPFVTSDTLDAHAANVAAMRAEARACRDKAKRARKYGASWLHDAAILDDRANAYAALFLYPAAMAEAA